MTDADKLNADIDREDFEIALAALREIRDLDYRGPKPEAQRLAEDALRLIETP